MALFPDRKPDPVREEVLSRCPFTREFIKAPDSLGLEAWAAKVDPFQKSDGR